MRVARMIAGCVLFLAGCSGLGEVPEPAPPADEDAFWSLCRVEPDAPFWHEPASRELRSRLFRLATDDAAWDAEAAGIVQDLFATVGWLDARVQTRRDQVDGRPVRAIAVEQGERYVVEAIRFEGNQAIASGDLEAALFRPSTREPCPEAGRVIIRGPALHLHIADDLAWIGLFLDDAKLESGQHYYTYLLLHWARRSTEDLYFHRGYLAGVEVVPVIDRERRRVQLTIKVQEGARRTLGEVKVEGDALTQPWLLDRLVTSAQGQPLDPAGIQGDVGRLFGTGWYSKVKTDVIPAGDSGADVTYRATPGQHASVFLGAGFTQDNDVGFGYVAVEDRHFRAAGIAEDLGGLLQGRLHLRRPAGGGETLRLEAREGSRIRDRWLRWSGPSQRWEAASYHLRLGRRELDVGEYTQDQVSVDAGPDVRLGDAWTLESRGLGGFARLTRLEADTTPETRATAGRYGKSGLSVALVHDSWSDTDRPSGWQGRLFCERLGGPFGGVDLTLARAELTWNRLLHGAKSDRPHVLSLGLGADWIEAYGDTALVPSAERFYAGGNAGPRGFDYRAVGPKVNGSPAGGRLRLTPSVRYRFPAWGVVRGEWFLDAANVARDIDRLRSDETRISTGLALGVGLDGNTVLGIYVAAPLRKLPGDELRAFGLNLGMEF